MEKQIENLLNAALRGNYEGARRIATLLVIAAKEEGKKDFATKLQSHIDNYESFAFGGEAVLDQHPLADIFNPSRIVDPKQASTQLQ